MRTFMALFRLPHLVALAGTALIAGCGGGGGGSNNPPPVAAPSALSYPTVAPLTVGTAMATTAPTVTGSVTTWSIAPALPAGLSFNSVSGVLSGTPTAVAAATNHTVTAANAGGSTTTTVSIRVNDLPPAVNYEASRTLLLGTAATLAPTSTGGAVVTWSVAPALPAGLTLGNDGTISGTPAAVSAATNYTITAVNSGGQSQATINIGIEDGALMDLGHTDYVVSSFKSGDRVLSLDQSGHWVLRSFASGQAVVAGDIPCQAPACVIISPNAVALANDRVVIDLGTSLELRDAATGAVAATIALAARPEWWVLASDASYVAAGSATALTVWSKAGAQIFSKAGDYTFTNNFSRARVFAAPAELRLALPALANQATIIETIALPAGTSTQTTALTGNFRSWFLDGESLLANTGNVVHVYSRLGVTQDTTTALPSIGSLGGSAGYFWALESGTTLRWYVVGAGGTPAATLSGLNMQLFPTATTLGIYDSVPNVFRLYTLATASGVTYNLPLRRDVQSYAQGAGSDWVLGLEDGVLVDGPSLATTPRFFTAGKARAIAAGTQFTSVATASGRVYVFDSATKASVAMLPIDAQDIKASADGATLAVLPWVEGPYVTDLGIRIYSLPATTPAYTWPATYGVAPYPVAIELSASGAFLERTQQTGSGLTGTVNPTLGGASTWSGNTHTGIVSTYGVRISPDGSRVASLLPQPFPGRYYENPTNIYVNGVLTGALQPAAPLVWLSNARVLAMKYRTVNPAGGSYIFDGAAIFDETGVSQATPTLPELARAQLVTADSIYAPELNTILSTVSGDTLWSSPRPIPPWGVGGVAGSRVVFVSRAEVRAEPR